MSLKDKATEISKIGFAGKQIGLYQGKNNDVKYFLEDNSGDNSEGQEIPRQEMSGLIKTIREYDSGLFSQISPKRVKLGETIIDLNSKEVFRDREDSFHIPRVMSELLEYFLETPGKNISREELFTSYIWEGEIDSNYPNEIKVVNVNVGRLRKILGEEKGNYNIILSIRNGWKLNPKSVGYLD